MLLCTFDPLALIRALNEHHVRFVVIGGIVAGVQGAIWATTDLDIVYARSRDDHVRLAADAVDPHRRPESRGTMCATVRVLIRPGP